MKDQIKKFLNEEQDPKAIEKITSKLADILMKNEEIGYIGVQKKPAITVFPDSIALTNKRIIICRPKNLGLSMDFVDYNWHDVAGTFIKENILGSEFSFATNTDIQVSIDYLPKIQARKIHTFAKEQLEILKNGFLEPLISNAKINEEMPFAFADDTVPEENLNTKTEIIENEKPLKQIEEVEEVEVEEVTHFAEIIPVFNINSHKETLETQQNFFKETVPEETSKTEDFVNVVNNKVVKEKSLADFSKDELFEKLQNYKKLLDNGLILQGEYDVFKKEILNFM